MVCKETYWVRVSPLVCVAYLNSMIEIIGRYCNSDNMGCTISLFDVGTASQLERPALAPDELLTSEYVPTAQPEVDA